MDYNAIKIDPADNVLVVIHEMKKGELIVLDGTCTFEAVESIPVNHKVALKNFKKGDEIVKYGSPIGVAITDIPKGGWVHNHNLSGEEILKNDIK